MKEKREKDKVKIKIEDLLKSHSEGLTIKEIMDETGLARHTILSRLHNFEGSGKVNVRQINMAKLHTWKKEDVPKLLKEHPEKLSVEDIVKETGLSADEIISELNELEEENIARNSGIPTKKEIVEVLGKRKSENKVKVTKLREEHIKEKPRLVEERKVGKKKEIVELQKKKVNVAEIKKKVEGELRLGEINKSQAQIKTQREPIKQSVNNMNLTKKSKKEVLERVYIETGIPGFDQLLEKGIPKGNTLLVAGGAGSGKTIFCLQTLAHHAALGKKCLVMSFEESKKRLMEHMNDFGLEANELIKKGNLRIQRFNPFDITRNVEALLAKQKGELLIDVEPVILPNDFNPDFILVDSLTSIASAFTGREESYRIYIEQLFRFFETIGATSFLITETEQVPKIFSQTGVEEFLADGVIVIYNLKRGNVRENAIEILKLRGAKHQKRIVAMNIEENVGIRVYPEQEVFGEINLD